MRAELIALEEIRDEFKRKSSEEQKKSVENPAEYIYYLGRANCYMEAYFRMKHMCEAIREENETNA